MSCTAVLGVVIGRGVNGDCEVIDGVRGEVGDFRESAVRLRVNAANSSFSATDWRRGERRRREDGGIDDMLDASLISVDARVETSVSASESVPDDDSSLADDDGRNGRLSEDVISGV